MPFEEEKRQDAVLLGTNENGIEFYRGSSQSGRAEVTSMDLVGNQILISRELQSASLSQNELDAYVGYRVAQITHQNYTYVATGILALLGGGVAKKVEYERNRNPKVEKKAQKHLQKAAELGMPSEPIVSRRTWNKWIAAAAGAVASGGLGKQTGEKMALESDMQKIIDSPVLASAIRKVEDWNKRYAQNSRATDGSGWVNSIEDSSDWRDQTPRLPPRGR